MALIRCLLESAARAARHALPDPDREGKFTWQAGDLFVDDPGAESPEQE